MESVEPSLKEAVVSQIKNRLKIEIPENEQQTLKQYLQGEISDYSLNINRGKKFADTILFL